MSSAPPSVYKSEGLIEEILEELDGANTWLFETAVRAKNVEANLRDLLAFAHGPDRSLQGEVECFVESLNAVKQRILTAEQKVNDICLECGWEVNYDEDQHEYLITGPCEDDEEKGE